MTSLYSLYNLQSAAGSFSSEVRFDPSHPVFAGHFPGQPVVPGVFLVEILVAAISQISGKTLVVKEASNLKFLQPVNPEVNCVVMLDGSIVIMDDGNYRVDATIYQGDMLFAKMKGVKLS